MMCQPNLKKRDAAPSTETSRKKRKEAAEVFEKPADKDGVSKILEQPDLMNNIFSFLRPRDLYNFSLTTKENLKALTYDQVIGAAVMQGEAAKTTVERLVKLVESRQIWTPSPFRLLCLVNGKRCEHCNRTRVRVVSETFGVFCCDHPCLKNGNMTRFVYPSKRRNPYLFHERVARAPDRTMLFCRPAATKSGVLFGPLITNAQLEQTMQGNGKDETPKEAMEKLLSELDAKDPHAKDAETIVSTFRFCEQEAKRQVEERREKQEAAWRMRAQQREEANAKNNEARKQKTLVMLEKLADLVGDVPWRSVFTTPPEWVRHQNKTKVIAKFASPLVEKHLHPLALAPSKATKKKLAEVAATLSEQFGVICSKGFHDGSFLSPSSDPFDKALFRCFQEEEDVWVQCRPRTVALVQQGKPVEALFGLLPERVRAAVVHEIAGPDPTAKLLSGQVWDEELRRGALPRDAFKAAKARALG